MGLTTSQRRAVTQTIATRYRRASKAEKGKILDGPAPATPPARHSVARRPRIVAPRPPRPVTYGPEVAAGLRFCSDLAPRLRRFGELEVSDDTAALLVAISPATIDRRLAADRGAMTLRGRSHTKPGSLLKDAIPIRTWTGPGGTTRCPGSWRSTWSATRAATPWGPRLHPHRKVRSPPAGRRTARHPTRPARHRTAARCQAAGFSASSLISGRPRRGRLADPVAPMPICCARPSPPGDRLRRAPRTAPRRARPARRGPTAEALAPFVEPTLGRRRPAAHARMTVAPHSGKFSNPNVVMSWYSVIASSRLGPLGGHIRRIPGVDRPSYASREEQKVTSSQPGQPEPTVPLASQYGTYGGKAAYARETSAGSWQVKVHDPTNLLAGHDGWVLLGEGWPTLGDACAATGLSYRP